MSLGVPAWATKVRPGMAAESLKAALEFTMAAIPRCRECQPQSLMILFLMSKWMQNGCKMDAKWMQNGCKMDAKWREGCTWEFLSTFSSASMLVKCNK